MKIRISFNCIMISFFLLSWLYNLINFVFIDRFLFIDRFNQLSWRSRYSRNLRIKLFSNRERFAKPYSTYSISNALTNFANDNEKLTSFSLWMIQLCKSLSSNQVYVLFVYNFFINVKLFKAFKIINIEACETTKIESEFFTQLVRLRAAITKKKHWEKMNLINVESNKKMNIEDENVLCMIWVNLNLV
jgi:hypothetical protein